MINGRALNRFLTTAAVYLSSASTWPTTLTTQVIFKEAN